jgi:hypothetical protein
MDPAHRRQVGDSGVDVQAERDQLLQRQPPLGLEQTPCWPRCARSTGSPRSRDALPATGDRPLAEDSPSDFEWGARDGQGGYTGHNYLGRALMRVRDELRQRPPDPPAGHPQRGRLPMRHPALAAAPRAQSPPVAREDIEREVLERCRRSSIPWRPLGRDAHGRLVLVADTRAGASRPGQRRRTTLTIDPAGLIYRHEALLPPADPRGGEGT